MATATITSKGQITIPKAVRESLHLHSGDRVEFLVQGETEAILRPITKSVDEVFGRLHKPGRSRKTVDEMRDAVSRRMRSRRIRRGRMRRRRIRRGKRKRQWGTRRRSLPFR